MATLRPFIRGHDGVLVVHANSTHVRWLGYWIECECGWIGPSCATEQDAAASHARHINKKKD